jgi:multiple sugar transport system ATP-binding protein
MVAGLEAISDGEIRVGGRVVNDMPPQHRNVAMVFQNYALYPHMTVRGNLEFPLRMQKLPRDEIARRIQHTAQLLNLTELLERRPKALSGGQRQRVAMGRAIVRDAEVFLMDEPLSNLDAKLRAQIRAEIAALQVRLGVTTMYVTHDQVEAMTLGQRVAVLRGGLLHQVAAPRDLYERPANIFVAGFIGSPGMNVLRASLDAADGGLIIGLGATHLVVPAALRAQYPDLDAWVGRELLVGMRPAALTPAEGEGEDTLPIQARSIESLGHETILYFSADASAVATDALEPAANTETAPAMAAVLSGHHPIRSGEKLRLHIDTSRLCFFDTSGKGVNRL